MTPMNTDTDRHCIDLTQLSSREQLSALMDGALPEDQTRFLLRRLQHDDELAGSWERWRIASDVMRGMAPARRLPGDFASRVSLALHGGEVAAEPAAATSRPAWLRRGAGMGALAAALAVVALMGRPALEDDASPAAPAQVAATTPAAPLHGQPAPSQPAPQLPTAPAGGSDMLAAASMAAAATASVKPARRSRPAAAVAATVTAVEASAQIAAVTPATPDVAAPEFRGLPEAEIVTRPWPRSILPQYAGSGGLAVGFGDHPRRADNPFAPPVFGAPPKLLSGEAASTQAAAGADAQGQPQP